MIHVSVPAERVPYLIGKSGRNKRKIEELAGVKLRISGTDVSVSGRPDSEYQASLVVRAVGLGFPVEKALNLLDDEYSLVVLELDARGEKLKRVKGLLIGKDGLVRKRIEEMTGADIVVSGRTVSSICPSKVSDIVSTALDRLSMGAKPTNIYAYVRRRMGLV